MQFDQKINNMISHSQTRDSAEQFMTEMKVKTPSLPVLSAAPTVVNYGTPEAMAIAFGENRKAQMAARAMFELVHQFGDNLREGWKNVLDLLMHLLRSNLLPQKLLYLEDFVDPQGHVSLKERFKRRQLAPKKEESGLFSWLGFTSSSGTGDADPKKPTEEEKELCKLAANVIAECHPENLIPDSRYLASSALTELINNIIQCSLAISPTTQQSTAPIQQQHKHENIHPPHGPRQQHESQGSQSQDDDSIVDLCPSAALLPAAEQQIDPALKSEGQKRVLGQTNSAASQISSNSDGQNVVNAGARQHFTQQIPTKLSIDEEESLAFLLELMVNIVLENRDRLAQVWSLVRDHLRWLLTHFPQNEQLMERVVVSIIRIANRNLFRLVSQQQSDQPMGMANSPNSPHQIGPNDGQKSSQTTTTLAVTKQSSTLVNTRSVVIVVDSEDEQPTKQVPHQHSPPQLDHQTIQQKTMTHCADEVLQFMGQQLLALRPPQLFLLSRQIAFGLQILLRTNAANVHSTEHWAMFFTLLEAVGAAAYQQDDDIEFIESKQWILHPGASITSSRKSAQQSRHQTVQSEPEDIVASSPMLPQAIDERGYCSDDPSSMLLGSPEEGESRGVKNSGPTAKRKPDNPLLVAAMEHREQQQQEHLRLLNKADSGEWIHVVPTTTPTMMMTTVAQQPPHHNLLQNIQEETTGTNITLPNTASPIQPLLAENVASEPPQAATDSTLNIAAGQSPPSIPQIEPVEHHSPPPPNSPQPQITATISSSSPPPIPNSQIPPQQQGQPAASPAPLPAPPPPHPRAGVFKRGTIVLAPNLSRHDPAAFLKVVETLTFLARDAAHITPANFAQFTHCLRMMVEASMDGGKCAPVQLPSISHPPQKLSPPHSPQSQMVASKEFPIPHENEKSQPKAKQQTTATDLTVPTKEETAISEQERLANCYMDASLQLLNICAQMHSLSANIYRDWADAGGINVNEDGKIGAKSGGPNGCTTELWSNYWRPLLQSIARMACDCRRRIRASALEALGAAFRVPALGELMQPMDWEDCFAEVLFPLLTRLLFSNPPISPMDPIGMEEARIRAIQLSCKILLGHLTRISQLDTFADLLRRLFSQMDQFLGESAACSDLLAEVIQESLKNTVLVCESFGIFQGPLAGLHGEMADRLAKLAQKHGAGLKMSL